MEQEIKKLENNSKTFWQFVIALIVILLVVLAGGIIIILLQGGHIISGQEVVSGAIFPLILFIPIGAALALTRKIARPTPRQEKIIKTMLIAALILLGANVLVFWLF